MSSSGGRQRGEEEKNEEVDALFRDVLACFGLLGSNDNRQFSRIEMRNQDTPGRLRHLVPRLRRLYTPCKARVYLEQPITERRCVTIFRHVLKLRDKRLLARERNVHGRKIIFYQVIDKDDVMKLRHMTKGGQGVVSFKNRGSEDGNGGSCDANGASNNEASYAQS